MKRSIGPILREVPKIAIAAFCLSASAAAEPCRYGCAYYPEPDTVTAAKRGDRTVVVNCSEESVETLIGKLDPFEVVFR